MQIKDLRCEYLINPLAIDVIHPKLSWTLFSERRNQLQQAYQIVVCTDEQVVWDSDKVNSRQTAHVEYQGKSLVSFQRCQWKVRVWNQDDVMSEWSSEAYWSMGLLSQKDWQAMWICMPNDKASSKQKKSELHLPPCRYFRKEIFISKPIKRAMIYGSAFGLYELHINGNKVGKDYLPPAGQITISAYTITPIR